MPGLTRFAYALICLPLVALSACGGESSAGAPAVPASTPSAPVWGKHDAPPDGVRRQVAFYGVGDQVCGPDEPGPLRIDTDRRPFYQSADRALLVKDEPEIGETLSLCPRGFATDEPITLRLQLPDGSTREAELPPTDQTDRFEQWFLDGDWPVGALDVVATQGAVEARRSLEVVQSRHPGARVKATMRRAPAPPESVRILLVGEPPNTETYIDLYRAAGTVNTYVTSIPLSIDERGVGQLDLPFDISQDAGQYVFVPRSAGASDDQDRYTDFMACPDTGCP